MSYGFLDIAVTPKVRAVQAKMGADRIWQDFKGHREFDRFTENEAAFIADRGDGTAAALQQIPKGPDVRGAGQPAGRPHDGDRAILAEIRGMHSYHHRGRHPTDPPDGHASTTAQHSPHHST